MSLLPCDGQAVCPPEGAPPPTSLERLLRWIAVATMLMTIPQVIAVWRGSASGVSLVSWSMYLVSSVAWLVYGLRKRDRTIWLVCIGWILLDVSIIAGIVVNG